MEGADWIGVELVVNGDFATDSDWDKGVGWSISGGFANIDGTQVAFSDLRQVNVSEIGETYIATLDLNISQGLLELKGSTGYMLLDPSDNGSATVIFNADSVNIRFTAYPAPDLVIDELYLG